MFKIFFLDTPSTLLFVFDYVEDICRDHHREIDEHLGAHKTSVLV